MAKMRRLYDREFKGGVAARSLIFINEDISASYSTHAS